MSSVKMKPTPMTRSISFGGEQPKTRLAVGAFAGLDEANVCAEAPLGAVGAGVGAVVERLVAASADVEHDADVDRAGRRPRSPARRRPAKSSATCTASSAAATMRSFRIEGKNRRTNASPARRRSPLSIASVAD